MKIEQHKLYDKAVEYYNLYLDKDDLEKLLMILSRYQVTTDIDDEMWDGETFNRALFRIHANLQDQHHKWHEPSWYDEYKPNI